jgi:hypothetical protein
MANNIAGGTNAVWGTTNLGLIGTNTNGNFAVLESISITDPNGKPIFIEGRNGTDAIAVMLDNGFDATLKSVFQTNVTLPSKGSVILMKLPNNSTGINVTVSGIEFDSQKKDMTRCTISAFYRPDLGA